MDTKPFSLQAPEAIAKEYGGNKQAIARASQAGLVDPTAAVLAGMFIDRMRNAAAQEQVPQQTVAQQVFAPPAPQMPAGLGATPQAQQMPQMPAAQPPAMMADGGLASLPIDESMFPDEYAGGGIVAFAGGGLGSTFDEYMPSEEGTTPLVQPEVPEELIGKIGLAQILDIRSGKHGRDKASILKSFGLGPKPITAAAAAPAAGPAATPPIVPGVVPSAPRVTAPGLDVSKLPALTDSVTPEKYKELQEKFGVSDKAEKTIQSIIDKLSGEGKTDRETAKNMALAQAGFAMMGGTSPYALTNIGKGAMEGMAQYGKDIKDIKAAERELSKLQIEQAKAEDARARGDFKGYQEYADKAQDHAIKLRKLGVDEKVAQAQIAHYNRPGTYEELGQAAEKYPWLKERFTSGTGKVDVERAKASLAAIDNILLTMKKDNPQRKKYEEQRAAILEQLSGVGGGVSGAGGKTLKWSDIQ